MERTASYSGEATRLRAPCGCTVALIDAENPASLVDPANGRWATACRTHGDVANHRTRHDADAVLLKTELWCTGCVAHETANAGD